MLIIGNKKNYHNLLVLHVSFFLFFFFILFLDEGTFIEKEGTAKRYSGSYNY
jgi:hypothetical protein